MQTTDVEISTGRIRGATFDGVTVFRGIPYAAPPVGERRWKAPQPVEHWARTRMCDSYGPDCPQSPYPDHSPYREPARPQSEDCLYLNIWHPDGEGDGPYPVMVWIHGGALTRGSGASPFTIGSHLARQGVVVVTFNYRLGVFGFFAHRGLTAESPNETSGNVAFLDQIFALQWVQREIHHFGGDPGRVTVFGESAGSWSVGVLLASPLTKGLFHRAIGQSGALFGPTQALDAAEERGEAVGATIACSNLDALRQLNGAELLRRCSETESPLGFWARPNVDGYLLKAPIAECYSQGAVHPVPVILGSNRDEWTTLSDPASDPKTLNDLKRQIERCYPGRWEAFQEVYRLHGERDVVRVFQEWKTDEWFTLPMRRWARYWESLNILTFLYSFDFVPQTQLGNRLGAYHAAEIGYVFNTRPRAGSRFSEEDATVVQALSTYWTNFASNSDPNGPDLPEWRCFERNSEWCLSVGTEIESVQGLRAESLSFLDPYDLPG